MLAIIWHSRTGTARALAQAVYEGASQGAEGADVCLLPASDVRLEDMLQAQGYVFVCPENLASITGVMKEFFDQMYYPLLGQIEGRAYATVIAAGSDGRGAQAQIDRIVTGWRLKRVADPVLYQTGAQTPEAIMAEKHVPQDQQNVCRDLGAAMAEGLRLGIF